MLIVAGVLVALVAALHVWFLVCVIVAGLFGAATVARRIPIVQALPAALALAAVVAAGS